ncbi:MULTISPECIES: AbrB/MazE/SpoVT family DNA-binding domain-containing protein [Haloferax]|uniref:SpoVT-AbrB domain-containing protein n=2 Tax=Haloferax TaxID=2251 RepID=A0A6G1Z3E4_9EURY|nr:MULTISPECIES: AbrB/MazE/SpoVT family DNA-binding domain-containing protein [Haloferax]KAB1188147.1 AbrB/MazE/SpoVT family DNA-binding domain-containing protein [Haloferax sp. CBA1149]MRW80824.1 hypothetical protein [Haloferax marinisediminis]
MANNDDVLWPPAMFTEQLRKAGEEFTQQQQRLYEQLLAANQGGSAGGLSDFGAMSMGTAMFKTRVQSGGRLSIPDAEREALGIEEGDLVQAFVIPISKQRDNNE